MDHRNPDQAKQQGYAQEAVKTFARSRKILKPLGLPVESWSHRKMERHKSIYNGFMIETIYRTPAPEKDKSECYVLVLTSRAATGGKVYAFMEEHGQWNEELQRFVYTVKSINTDEQLTFPQALSLYEASKRNLADKGFLHSFSPDGQRKRPIASQEPEPQLAFA